MITKDENKNIYFGDLVTKYGYEMAKNIRYFENCHNIKKINENKFGIVNYYSYLCIS